MIIKVVSRFLRNRRLYIVKRERPVELARAKTRELLARISQHCESYITQAPGTRATIISDFGTLQRANRLFTDGVLYSTTFGRR